MHIYLLVYRWSSSSTPFALYTEGYVRRIHRGLDHPSIRPTEKLLQIVRWTHITDDTRKQFAELQSYFRALHELARSPRRFKQTFVTDTLMFNHWLIVDSILIDASAVIHTIIEATHFITAPFLRNQSTEKIWNYICRLWTHTYMGPPNLLWVDQRKENLSKEIPETL